MVHFFSMGVTLLVHHKPSPLYQMMEGDLVLGERAIVDV